MTAYEHLQKLKHHIINVENKPKESILDVVIMYCESDLKYIPEAITTLPDFARIILVETIEHDDEWHLHVTNIQNNLVEITLSYPKNSFRFDTARNYINTFCDSNWIFHLDADERLLTHQHELLYNLLTKLPEKYLAINTGIINVFQFKDETGFNKKTFENVTKIYRNCGLRYEYPIHETICNDVYRNDGLIYDSELTLHHVGYFVSIDKLIEKFERNIELIWKFSELRKVEIFKEYLYKSIISINQLRGLKNG